MASQLREVLNRFSEQSAPVSINQMAREMQIEPGVLQEMLAYWVRKGKLREVSGSGEQCFTCGIKSACPFIVTLPRYYELVQEGEVTSSEPPCTCGGTSCH
ncbi:MAG: FeoC-like transcriptional regulator [Chloroflexota bacterium]